MSALHTTTPHATTHPAGSAHAATAHTGPGHPASDPLHTSAFPLSDHDPVEAYFECITTCSIDDGECVTTCTELLRESC